MRLLFKQNVLSERATRSGIWIFFLVKGLPTSFGIFNQETKSAIPLPYSENIQANTDSLLLHWSLFALIVLLLIAQVLCFYFFSRYLKTDLMNLKLILKDREDQRNRDRVYLKNLQNEIKELSKLLTVNAKQKPPVKTDPTKFPNSISIPPKTSVIQVGSANNSTSNNTEYVLEKQAYSIILKHLNNPDLNVQVLADALFMSERQLYRKIKSSTGMTPIEFINSIRLEAAGDLIRKNKSLTIDHVAKKVGFKSRSYFTRLFKKTYGTSPGKYQNS